MPTIPSTSRSSLLGAPLERARTLPGRWYADPDAPRARARRPCSGAQWVGVGCADDVAAPGSYLADRRPAACPCSSSATTPARCGRSSTCAATAARRSPRAAVRPARCRARTTRWVYRLDGSLARAGGVGAPDGFDPADFGLRAVAGHDVRPLGARQPRSRRRAVRPRPARPRRSTRTGSTSSSSASATRYERRVQLEGAARELLRELPHAVRPLAAARPAGYEYPIECAGPVVIAWDRPLAPRDASEQALHDHRPGDAGWAARRRRRRRRVVQQRRLPRRVPEHGDLVLRRVRRDVPADADRPVDHASSSASTSGTRRSPAERRAADLAATREVVEQDLRMCEALQRTYDAGLSADGVLSTEHEPGVAHVHQLLLARSLAG